MSNQAPWKVERPLLADAPQLARNNASAFWEDGVWKLLWEGVALDFVIEQMTKRVPQLLIKERDVLRHQKAVDPDTGKLLGYARWILPATCNQAPDGQIAWAEAQQPEVTEEERKKIAEVANSAWWKPRNVGSVGDRNASITGRILAQKPYIELEYLAVHPENHRKGIATALVKSGIQAADKLGVDIFVLAKDTARPVYERLGFKEIERNVEDLTKWGGSGPYAAYFMVYEAKKVDTD
ncbi:acyl-CoA N-acyltransferase [Thozetella sp. PMI_491]|nr:acyl-CoA N-acyltransferase [Thozetella sp. PMI_491]